MRSVHFLILALLACTAFGLPQPQSQQGGAQGGQSRSRPSGNGGGGIDPWTLQQIFSSMFKCPLDCFGNSLKLQKRNLLQLNALEILNLFQTCQASPLCGGPPEGLKELAGLPDGLRRKIVHTASQLPQIAADVYSTWQPRLEVFMRQAGAPEMLSMYASMIIVAAAITVVGALAIA